MRCKACDNPLSDEQQWFKSAEGVNNIPEECCGKCLSIIKSMMYGKDEDVYVIIESAGIEYEADTEGGL